MRVDTRLSRVLAFLLPVASVAALGILANGAFVIHRFEHLGELLFANLIAGLYAGMFVLANSVSCREDLETKRARTIAEMNHRIRNAVTVLVFHGTRREDPEARAAVMLAMQRIECALEEILPQGWSQEPESYTTQKMISARGRQNPGSETAEARQL
jgi:hypothetical protein